MQNTGPLSANQVNDFHATGFVIARGLFNAEEMANIRSWTDDVQAWPETPGRHMMYFETCEDTGDRLLNRVENLLPYHQPFDDLANGSRMKGACAQLFGEPAVIFKDKINFKLPGGGGFETHQDVQAGWSRYSDFHITALVSIDRATVANGCLEVAAGFHDRGLIGNEWEPLDDGLLCDAEFQYIETEPGDAVFFDSFAPHRSGPNKTGSARRLLYFTYNRLSAGDHLARYYADKRESYPPDVERDPGKEYQYRV
ncbi:MAG: phytanoyl-CoA dioxygenase family protein [Gammaproteobacteria bacterium]|nr:phytanoyl-CoA dioxygenase family protein [Gammaproteobacteria bacterium]